MHLDQICPLIKEGGEANYDVHKEELIEYDEQGTRYAYVTEEDESN